MTINLRRCTVDDLPELQKISYETFDETFRDHNTRENMEAYLDNAYTSEKLESELNTKGSRFYFLYFSDVLAGYLKLNIGKAQTEDMSDQSLELERIYIKTPFQKKGLGKHLINKAIETAEKLDKKEIWLGVWEYNENALGFYKQLGFVRTGAHSFFMGTDEQTDYIMTKTLV